MGSFQNKRVSDDWEIVLEAAWEDGVRFQLNSGQRTMGEQRTLFNQNMLGPGIPRPGHAFTAVPNANAPHLRAVNHALDVDSFAHNDGENRLQRWLVKQGVNPRNTVPGESWHLELTRDELERLADRFRAKWKGYTPSERRWITEYDKIKLPSQRRTVLRRVMKEQRKRIWREAQETGWKRSNRIKRYASLRARS